MNTQELKELSNRIATIETKLGIVNNPKLEVGKWYLYSGHSRINIPLMLITSIGHTNFTFKGFDFKGFWTDSDFYPINEINTNGYKEATPQEVEEALIKEAKRRGLLHGVRFVSPNGEDWGFKVNSNDFHFDEVNNTLSFTQDLGGTVFLFIDGHWAEPIIEQHVDKFAELKEAHRNGAVIQYRYSNDEEWDNTFENKPSWQDHCQYRIKPGFGWSNNVDSKTWTIRFNDPTQSIHDDIKALMDKYPKYRFAITVEDKA